MISPDFHMFFFFDVVLCLLGGGERFNCWHGVNEIKELQAQKSKVALLEAEVEAWQKDGWG